MAYAVVQDIASSWEHYEHIAARLTDPAPPGLILHLAGPTDEGFRVIGIWDSQPAWHAFRADRLHATIAALPGTARPEPTIRDLHALHVVLGPIPPETIHLERSYP